MKGDFSRYTFDPARHFTSVRMQQGRVQLDADWNEQADLTRHRGETGTRDLVGHCGGPLHGAAFRVLPFGSLDAATDALMQARYPAARASPAGDFVVGAGHYYVNGVLCTCEEPVPYSEQPDLPDAPDLAGDGFHLVYLDVWDRHLTALEVPRLREPALGGPDTATRTRTVWQVRTVFAGAAAVGCEDAVNAYDDATAPTTGRLRARARVEGEAPDPCVIPPTAGYRGLENQLYRVEIHDEGNDLDLGGAVTSYAVVSADPAARRVTVDGGSWGSHRGRPVEIYFTAAGQDPAAGILAWIESTAAGGGGTSILTLATPIPEIPAAGQPRLRRARATYKWSRDNGIVASRVLSLDGDEVVVESLGVDDVLAFQPGQWVELTDDATELNGLPGQMARIETRNANTRTLTLSFAPLPLAATADGVDPERRPKLRRWDGVGAVKTGVAADDGYAALEDGVEVRFEDGSYRTAEHWLVPARTATAEAETGTVDWPREGADGAALRPLGIHHHYCRLAVVQVAGGTVSLVEDCRCLFAPLTEVNALEYVGGAGQEAMPDPLAAGERIPLGLPLVAGIASAHCSGDPLVVRFRVVRGTGDLSATEGVFAGAAQVDVTVAPDGLARCWCRLDGDTQHQLVEARLLEQGVPVQLPVLFNASLSVASQVAYDPAGCGGLAGQNTVQRAISRLAAQTRLYLLSGDAQEVMPQDVGSLAPLRVRAASACGRVGGRAVTFSVASGGGTLNGAPAGTPVTVDTDGNGVASVSWVPGAAAQYQEVEAVLSDDAARPAAEPSRVRFTATLSTAAQVAYTPAATCEMAGEVETVQEALDFLCARRGGGCHGLTVSPGPEWLAQVREFIQQHGEVDICFRAGEYVLEGEHLAVAGLRTAVFHGAGPATRFLARESTRVIEFKDCGVVQVRGLAAETVRTGGEPPNGVLAFHDCRSVTVEEVWLRCPAGERRDAACLAVMNTLDPGAPPPDAEVTVRGCDLVPGHRQIGLLLVNPGRAVVEGNHVRGFGLPADFSPVQVLRQDGYREFLALILSALLRRDVAGQTSFYFAGPWWRRLHGGLMGLPAEDLEQPVESLFRRLPETDGDVPPELARWVAALETAAAQGIVVGGTAAGDVLVRGNTVERTTQGIHVGLSHGPLRDRMDRVDRVAVSGNSVSIVIPFGFNAERHGIFVGNAHSALVDGNRLVGSESFWNVPSLKAFGAFGRPVDGIRAFGAYGPMLIVRENHMEGFPTGIRVHVVNADPEKPSIRGVWRVTHNVAEQALQTVVVSTASVIVEGNFP
jgi:hypothetical protein